MNNTHTIMVTVKRDLSRINMDGVSALVKVSEVLKHVGLEPFNPIIKKVIVTFSQLPLSILPLINIYPL